MGTVTKLYPKDAAKNPDAVLEQAIGNFESVFVVGWDKSGKMDARASTNISKESIVWLIKKFEHKLMSGDYDETT